MPIAMLTFYEGPTLSSEASAIFAVASHDLHVTYIL